MTRELGMAVGGGLCSSRREMDIFLFSTTIFHVRVQYYEMSIEFIERDWLSNVIFNYHYYIRRVD